MLKKLLSLAAALALCLTLLPALPVSAAQVLLSPQKLTVDGNSISCEKYNIDGRNYFKLRDLALLLTGTGSRFSVDWDAAAGQVTVASGRDYTPDGSELRFSGESKADSAVPSAQTIVIDGTTRTDLSVWNIGGNNFFQLRELGAALNFSVDYDAASDTAIVLSAGASQDPAPTSVRLGQTEDMGRDYLNKLIFLGDSTTYCIAAYYKAGYTELCPPEQVWTPRSGTLTLAYYNIATVVYPPTGEEISIAEAAKRAQPEYLVITLGINGIAFMDETWFKRDYGNLVKLVQEASPNTKIILNSIYPVAASYVNQTSINNTKISAANGWIEKIAEDTGCRFLNSYECLIGENGYLPETSQNGDGLHLTGEALTVVMNYIRTHAWV